MSVPMNVLKNDELAIFRLRELYGKYGYMRYKVSKFEEYDLYARNKSFLISENILTFTDTDGRLMALKPDVTLSIIKNLGKTDGELHKLCYNETVYRTSGAADGFREIMQTGLECVGKVDLYAVCEVITLAQKSLELISEDNILDISHMGFILALMEELGVEGGDADTLVDYIGSKNIPAIRAFCSDRGISSADADALCEITALYSPIESALRVVEKNARNDKMRAAYEELRSICEVLRVSGNTEKIYIDFSTVNDMNYYNGVIFKGFMNGIPDSILSGGRYDNLMKKMGKCAGAIGFAVYLDMLDRLNGDAQRYDVDTVLLYGDDSDMAEVTRIAAQMRDDGIDVRTERGDSSSVRCRRLMKVTREGAEMLETND